MNTKTATLCALAIGLSAFAAPAQTLLSDNFNGTAGTSIFGVAVQTTASALSGNTYVRRGSTGNPVEYDTNGTRLRFGSVADEGLAIAFKSVVGFDVPEQIKLSVTFDIGTLTGNLARNDRGIGIGFYSTTTPNTSSANDYFYGLLVDPLGQLTLMQNGASTPLVQLSIFSALTSGVNYTLSYEVNTLTGAFSNIIFNGQLLTISTSGYTNNIFTGSVLNNVGLITKAQAAGQVGYIDSFEVIAVPEPAVTGLLLGSLAICVFLRSRRQAAKRKI